MSKLSSPLYTLCETPESVANAVAVLTRSKYLVLDCEGKSIGRPDGILSLICIGTAGAKHIFVFDVLSLKRDSPPMRLLLELLSKESVIKITWDGRQDFLEIYDNYGIRLGGVFDLQLAEVMSRSTVHGETDAERLERFSSGWFGYALVRKRREDFADVHVVIGMQKCLEQTNLSGNITKDPEVVAMHRAGGSALWMQRPLPPRLLAYAANDIRAIDMLFQHFVEQSWVRQTGPDLLRQSKRYVSSQLDQGRMGDENPFRLAGLMPLDILVAPQGTLGKCTGCNRMLSLRCFHTQRRQGRTVRRARCRLCGLIADRPREKRQFPADDRWLDVEVDVA